MTHRSERALTRSLERCAAASGEPIAALAPLVRFVLRGPRPDPAVHDAVLPHPTSRLRMLLAACRGSTGPGGAARAALIRVGVALVPYRAFVQLGIPNARGLWTETTDRLARALLPTPRLRGDLGDLLGTCFRRRRDVDWLASLDSPTIAELGALIAPAVAAVTDAAEDAAVVLASGVAALGLAEDIRARSPEVPLRASPFFRLTQQRPSAEMLQTVAACRDLLAHVHEHLEETGVSVDIVYRLDVIARSLGRIEDLIRACAQTPGTSRAPAAVHLVAKLAAARRDDRRIRAVGRAHIRLLTRKVIERTGQTGEHYIAKTRREWLGMWLSAAGGGFLTAFTCVLKFLIKWQHWPPFVDGMASSVNYAGSFLLMQLFGFTLATKQPSMTVAALAGSIKRAEERFSLAPVTGPTSNSAADLDPLVDTLAAMCRSQLAAIAGNIGAVVPVSLAVGAAYAAWLGRPFLDPTRARHTIESLHPTHSGTLFFAAWTGVLLWASSLGAGWLENWVVFRRIPRGIEEHPLGRIVGAQRMAKLARVLTRQVAGIGGNVSIGFLLGMTPAIGTFFGLPLDIRHVTLSSGALALSVLALGPQAALAAGLGDAALGVLGIGALNLFVSGLLAVLVALSAREIGWRLRWRLLVRLVVRVFRRPLDFFFPRRVVF